MNSDPLPSTESEVRGMCYINTTACRVPPGVVRSSTLCYTDHPSHKRKPCLSEWISPWTIVTIYRINKSDMYILSVSLRCITVEDGEYYSTGLYLLCSSVRSTEQLYAPVLSTSLLRKEHDRVISRTLAPVYSPLVGFKELTHESPILPHYFILFSAYTLSILRTEYIMETTTPSYSRISLNRHMWLSLFPF